MKKSFVSNQVQCSAQEDALVLALGRDAPEGCVMVSRAMSSVDTLDDGPYIESSFGIYGYGLVANILVVDGRMVIALRADVISEIEVLFNSASTAEIDMAIDKILRPIKLNFYRDEKGDVQARVSPRLQLVADYFIFDVQNYYAHDMKAFCEEVLVEKQNGWRAMGNDFILKFDAGDVEIINEYTNESLRIREDDFMAHVEEWRLFEGKKMRRKTWFGKTYY